VNHGVIERAEPPDTVRCAPLPDWVAHRPYEAELPGPEHACIANGICRLLLDTQVDLSGPELAWHCRIAQRVLTRAGAERAAHFVTEFDPSFQRLEVHLVRVLRGEETFEHAARPAIQTFRRETNLERLMFDGRLTASLLIPDVRPGDVIETAYTCIGSNPTLAGKFAAFVSFDCFDPWLETRHRMLRPGAREIFVKALNDPPPREIAERDGIEESQWRIVGQQRRDDEELVPPWLIRSPSLQFAEFRSWGEVADLLAPFYEPDTIPDALAEEIERLAAAHQEPAARAAEWLRFVQQHLRYFSLGLGEGGLIPRPVGTIWAGRLGDCKDAARLYVAGARRLGLDACAALVSTTHGPALDGLLPSAAVFDHCIVRLRLNGACYWLDPTMEAQRGRLESIFQPQIGWALTLSSQTTGLEAMGTGTAVHVLNSEEVLRFGPKRASPAQLHRRLTHLSWGADLVRRRIASQGAAEYAKDMLKGLRAIWPAITETRPIEIIDDPVENRLTTVHAYEIADCWTKATSQAPVMFGIEDTLLIRELPQIAQAPREADIFLARPRKLTRRVRFVMPRRWRGTPWQHEVGAPGVSFRSGISIEGGTILDSRELSIDAWSLPARHADAYREVVRRIGENRLDIVARERFGSIRPLARRWWGLNSDTIWMVAVVLLLLVALVRILAGPT
jgi:transglutaminase-like putative cysteine protease